MNRYLLRMQGNDRNGSPIQKTLVVVNEGTDFTEYLTKFAHDSDLSNVEVVDFRSLGKVVETPIEDIGSPEPSPLEVETTIDPEEDEDMAKKITKKPASKKTAKKVTSKKSK